MNNMNFLSPLKNNQEINTNHNNNDNSNNNIKDNIIELKNPKDSNTKSSKKLYEKIKHYEVKSYFNETIIGKNNSNTTKFFSPSVSDMEIDKPIIQLTENKREFNNNNKHKYNKSISNNSNSLASTKDKISFDSFKSIFYKGEKFDSLIMNNNKKLFHQYKKFKEDKDNNNNFRDEENTHYSENQIPNFKEKDNKENKEIRLG